MIMLKIHGYIDSGTLFPCNDQVFLQHKIETNPKSSKFTMVPKNHKTCYNS